MRQKHFFSLSGVLFLAALLVGAAPAAAITIDDFSTTPQSVVGIPSQTVSTGFSAPLAIGGNRVLGVASTSGDLTARVALRILLDSTTGVFRHSQEDSSSGSTSILWHGTTSTTLVGNGFGAVNLQEDGATAFRLTINSFDFGFGTPISGRITIYDAAYPSGVVFSSVNFNIAEAIQIPESIDIPFSGLSSLGTPASLGNVGAIKLEFFGAGTALDLSVDWFGTNGSCALVPSSPEGVVDQCGVCGGNNSTCLDCVGTPNGPAQPGTGCSSGQFGQCSPGTYNQSCACSGTPPSSEICDSIDNNCDGAVDNGIGVCTDCAGTSGGTAILDRCGVCNGDGNSCLSCVRRNISDLLTAMDGGAKRQEMAIRRIVKGLDVVVNPKQKRQLEAIRVEAHRLQIINWIVSWTIPVNSVVCDNREFCVTTSNQPIIDDYRVHAEELRVLGLKAIAFRKRLLRTPRRALDRFVFDVNEIHAQNVALLASVPVEQFSCS